MYINWIKWVKLTENLWGAGYKKALHVIHMVLLEEEKGVTNNNNNKNGVKF